jgi:hypothetical protein
MPSVGAVPLPWADILISAIAAINSTSATTVAETVIALPVRDIDGKHGYGPGKANF